MYWIVNTTIIIHSIPTNCETWSLTVKEECRLGEGLFENRILRRIFGPKRGENGDWRRLQNEELHSLYRSPNIVKVIKSRRLRRAGHVARKEEDGGAFKMLTGNQTYRKETFKEA